MKKGDLKKLSKEEKPGLVNKLKFVYLIFNLLFVSASFAQIPLNGFVRYREFNTKPNYTNIFSMDFNNDGYRDLIIYNSISKNYVSHTSDIKSDLGHPSEKTSQFAISAIHPFGSESSAKKFVILSRKTRQVGVARVSAGGVLSVSSKVLLNGYPSNIDVNTTQGNGKQLGLVSGPLLNGAYVLSEGKKGLEAERVIEGKIFLSAYFIDLNYDTNPDIVAVDPLSYSIIFYNNRFGKYEEAYSIGLNEEISEFKTVDFNSDRLTDLAYIKGKQIEILLGDSVSAFKRKVILETPVKADKYTILDFNGDGYNDIAYLNTKLGELYISFAQGQNSFYPPILFMKKNGLVDLTAYIDRAGRKLAALSSDGKIYLVNSLGMDLDSFSLSLGIKPGAVQSFDYLNDRYKDFCFIDNGVQALKLFLSERRNLFRTYYKIPLLANSSEIKTDDTKERIKTFFCYSKGGRAIEAVRMDFDTQKFSRLLLNTNGIIIDLKLSNDRLKDRENVSVLIKKNRQLYLQNIELREFQNASSDDDLICNNFDDAWITFNVYKEIYYVTKSVESVELYKLVFDKKIIESRSVLRYSTIGKTECSYDFVGLDELVNRVKPAAFLISINRKAELNYISKDQVKKNGLRNQLSTGFSLGCFYNEPSDEVSFYFVNKLKGKLAYITIGAGNNLKDERDIIESKPINNYFVTDINKIKRCLVYTDGVQNVLTFEKVK
jgi:hypothetical protein